MKITVMISLILLGFFVTKISSEEGGEDGYSYYKFRGPVSGLIRQVPVQSHNNHPTFDYVAKPDYAYSYGVQDPESGNSQTHRETRDGDAVHGEYRVLQADGIVRVVRYTADGEHGFQATVTYENP